ncbi:MAG TPA: hypothetical protein PLC99_22535 [Verrucomicrobiota bacterium]|nr:hypothetical protein [Verrucomicrobiota bacterium]
MTKPQHASEYKKEQTDLVRATCLYVATKLGDLVDDIVIVGGLVPQLIIDQEKLPSGTERHVGTTDLDVGLEFGLLGEGRYHTLAERLRGAGFGQDLNEQGNVTRQRWRHAVHTKVTVDFLIQEGERTTGGGRLFDLEQDFAAIIAPGLRLAFLDRLQIELDGQTILGERATRKVWVCGPGAFVVLKALAFDGRGENKDAYDLYYVVRNFGRSAEEVAEHVRPLLGSWEAQEALEILKRDFLERDRVGPRRVAAFLRGKGKPDDELQADVVGFVRRLLDLCK